MVAPLNQLSSLPPSPLDDDLGEKETSPLIVVHMSPQECDYLDYFQGGTSEDPKTGFREYSRISNLMDIPEIRNIWDGVFSEMITKGKTDEFTTDVVKSLPSPEEKPFQFTAGDFNPEGEKIEATGEIKHPEDSEAVLMPIDFANYLDLFKGDDRDPIYGLRQYGGGVSKGISSAFDFVGKVVKEGFVRPLHQVTGIKMTRINEGIRVASTIGGYMVGGPFGAGVGTAAGNIATGADPMKSLGRGLKVGLAAHAAESIAGGIGNAFGGTQTGAGVPTSVNGMDVTSQLDKLAPAAGIGGGSSLFGGSNLLPLAAIGALMYGGAKEDAKREQDLEVDHEAALEAQRVKHGWNIPFRPQKFSPRSVNPVQPSEEDRRRGRQHQHFIPDPYGQYAKGGDVKYHTDMLPGEEFVTSSKYLDGDTHGQADEIPINLPEGAYIIDASTTSMLGDGNSKAGANVLHKLDNILKHKSTKLPHVENTGRRVPALLSDGEYIIEPKAVSALGDGSNKRGASILKKMVKNIRKDKSRNGGGLPPKSKNILEYLPNVARSV